MASSRELAQAAGWSCSPGAYESLLPAGLEPFSWLRLSTVWQARNDTLARALGDPTHEQRPRWIAAQRDAGAPEDLTIDRTDLDAPSFLVLGDTGEGDESQYAVVPPLLATGADTDFMLIAGDVVYPAGDAADYEERFYRPYRDYPAPIYAVPGNHDWYDGLEGFMLCFCGAAPLEGGGGDPLSRAGVERLLRRRSEPMDAEAVLRMRALRGRPDQQVRQPGPYFALDTGPLLILGIDTGILGELDADQGAWLRARAASSPKPKLLIAGSPLYRNGAADPRPIVGGGTVQEIVSAPQHNFVATLGGDTHNYQRYPVRLDDGRLLQHIVCGGGGGYLNETHSIPVIDLPGVQEADVRLYPLRGDSLAIYSRMYERWAQRSRAGKRERGTGSLELGPDVAAAIMGERLGISPVRPVARGTAVDEEARHAASVVFPLGGYRGLNRFFSQYFDWNEPPMFRSFLRLDVTADALQVRCFAATGCAEHDSAPPLEDETLIPLADAAPVPGF
jgi:hypothetical protein